ncbi:MAG TPA: thioredoxin-dependent thiol peroxidase [Verrucomicrobiae bacterium]|jgi:peroxiredoxin Q/BCP|nr:thioredoxin-dependent thiol peroxidase [Verrucomicrobiae bacterium]
MPAASKTASSSSALKEGASAPAFNLPSTEGANIRLSDYKGKKNVVLYFYPKDDTPGCTREACDFRDNLKKIQARDAVILGVSPDSVAAHDKFRDKYKLPFTLLSDESKEMLERYGVWKEKSLYGRKYMGVERTTLIINKKGQISRIFPKVKVEGHWQEVLEALENA